MDPAAVLWRGGSGVSFLEMITKTDFVPKVYRLMLHRQVMVLAITRIEGAWKAYCYPVEGQNHDREQEEVLARGEGSQLQEGVARAMFGHLEDLPYAL
jgi:hypothetical protein